MPFNLLKLFLIFILCVAGTVALIAFRGFDTVDAKTNFTFDAVYFCVVALLSLIIRFAAGKQKAVKPLLYLQYAFSLTYTFYCLFTPNDTIFALSEFAIILVAVFISYTNILPGHFIIVITVLITLNGVMRRGKLFYAFMQIPAAHLVCITLAIIFANGLQAFINFISGDKLTKLDESDRLKALKWWFFFFRDRFETNKDTDLDVANVEVRNVTKAKTSAIQDRSLLILQSPEMLSESLTRITQRDGNFSYEAFVKRGETIYRKVMSALSENAPQKVEHLISDSLFKRFSYLTETTKRAACIPVDLIINELQVAQVNLEASFDILQLFLRATSYDFYPLPHETSLTAEAIKKDKSKTLKETHHSQYLTFIRKPSARTKDAPGLLEGQCPNCGAPIEIGQATRCPACSSFIRSGDHDWVLTKITAASSYTYTEPSLLPGCAQLTKTDNAFSPQQIEDKAAVLFWHLRSAEKARRTDPLKHYANDTFCKTLEYELKNDVFNRFAYSVPQLDSISLKAISREGADDFCYLLAAWRAEAAKKLLTMRDVYVFTRKSGAKTKQNNALSSCHCSNCGAPLASSHEAVCAFCSTPIIDDSDWILTRVIKESDPEYLKAIKPLAAQAVSDASHAGPQSITNSPNDIILITAQMLMADKKIDPAEMQMLRTIAKRYSIPEQSLQEILESIKNGRVHVPVPKPGSIQAQSLIRDAAKMALADKTLADSEQQALLNLGMQLGYTKLDVNTIINKELTKLTKPKY